QHYSPQFVESLPKLSLQNIDAKMNFVETMNQTMQQCQDRNSRNDGMHEASDPATSHDMNKNS
ncbi:hypothetical protein LDX79_20955, partial [Acinetobacter baumannii]|nr:hypothetical protein [Acinetobacter baumannii]